MVALGKAEPLASPSGSNTWNQPPTATSPSQSPSQQFQGYPLLVYTRATLSSPSLFPVAVRWGHLSKAGGMGGLRVGTWNAGGGLGNLQTTFRTSLLTSCCPAACQFPPFTSLRSTHLPTLPSPHFSIYSFVQWHQEYFLFSYFIFLASQSTNKNPTRTRQANPLEPFVRRGDPSLSLGATR